MSGVSHKARLYQAQHRLKTLCTSAHGMQVYGIGLPVEHHWWRTSIINSASEQSQDSCIRRTKSMKC